MALAFIPASTRDATQSHSVLASHLGEETGEEETIPRMQVCSRNSEPVSLYEGPHRPTIDRATPHSNGTKVTGCDQASAERGDLLLLQ